MAAQIPVHGRFHMLYDCSYLNEFNKNLSMREHIAKHVCSNFADRFDDEDGRRCVFHATRTAKNRRLGEAIAEKLERGHYIFFGTIFTAPVDLRDCRFATLCDFRNCVFEEEASFENASFDVMCDFASATFKSRVSFKGARFTSEDRLAGIPQIEDVSILNDFRFVQFWDIANFDFTEFNADVDFAESMFNRSGDKYANERLVKEGETSFLECEFRGGAIFKGCEFGNRLGLWDPSHWISFRGSTFHSSAVFRSAHFNLCVGFEDATFKGVADFRDTTARLHLSFDNGSFETYAKFSGATKDREAWRGQTLSFQGVNLQQPGKVSFTSLSLDPAAFVNTPLKDLHFVNIKWSRKNFAWDWSRVKDFRFWRSEAKQRRTEYQFLSTAYRGVAKNAEENDKYHEASQFRYTASEIERIGPRWYGRFTPLSWAYKWSSRYGEVWWWAALVLLGIIAAFTVYYNFAFFEICPKGFTPAVGCVVRTMTIPEAIHQSLMTGALQTVEYRKTIHPAQDLMILLEKIFVPIQAALLLLAIRRKYMR